MNFRLPGLLLAALAFWNVPALAADVKPLSQVEADLFSLLHLVFPGGEDGDQQPKLENETRWDIRIWSVNEADECTYDNVAPACKGMTLYISVAPDGVLVPGIAYALRTEKAYHWSIQSIRQVVGSRGADCALLILREKRLRPHLETWAERNDPRLSRLQSSDLWEFRDLSVCVSDRGLDNSR